MGEGTGQDIYPSLNNNWSWQYLSLTQTQTPDSYDIVNDVYATDLKLI